MRNPATAAASSPSKRRDDPVAVCALLVDLRRESLDRPVVGAELNKVSAAALDRPAGISRTFIRADVSNASRRRTARLRRRLSARRALTARHAFAARRALPPADALTPTALTAAPHRPPALRAPLLAGGRRSRRLLRQTVRPPVKYGEPRSM